MFPRIPDVNDDVQISVSSSDQITLSSIVTIKSLEISGGWLVLRGSGQLTVTGQFIQSSERLDIYGVLLAKSFTWSGRYIYGVPQGTGSNLFGQITVTDKMVIQKGSYGYKSLYDIDIYCKKNLTIEQTMEYSSSLTCLNCIITIGERSVFILPGVNLYVGSTSSQRPTQSDGFRRGLINYGSVVMAIQRSSSWRWDLRNYANMTLVCVYYSSTYSISFYNGVVFNNGSLRSYSTSLYFNSGSQLVSGGGRFLIYGVPGVYSSNYDNIPGHRKPWLYKDYIRYLYENDTYLPKIWDTNPTVYILFQSFYNKEMDVSVLRTFGKVQLYLYSWQHSRFTVSGSLRMSPESSVMLGNSGSSSSYTNNTFLVGENATEAVFGDVSIMSAGYVLQIQPLTANVTMGRVTVAGRLVLGACFIRITREIVIGPNGRVLIRRVSATWVFVYIHFSRVQAMGPVIGNNSRITVSDTFLWKQSRIQGTNTLLLIRGVGEISGDLGKTLDGVDLVVGAPPESCPKSGVIAEYFQYRVATATTPVISSIYNYYSPGSTTSSGVLPQQFDNTSSVPTYSTIESGISRTSVNYGSAPIVFNDDNPNNINYSSPLTFTYNYAVRMFTFLKIDKSGNYKFYFITGRGRVRLWINDQVRFTGRSYTSFMEEQKTQDIHLTAGYHKLRVDNIVISSYWSTRGSILYVLYEGPGVVKQTLPEEKQFFCNVNDTTGLNEYPANNPRVSSYTSVGGEGLILSRNNASVTVEQTGQLDFVFNSVWYSSGNSSTTFYNYGVISKTGVIGSATICGTYVNRGGQLIHSSGNVDFRRPTAGGCGLVFWNNSAGGTWNNPYNWDPPRIPDETDLVYITLAGSPTVIIPGSVAAQANTLIVGGSDSNPQLRVELYGKLNVSDRMDVYSDTLTVRGTVEISRFTWSGQTIQSGSSSSTDMGTMIVHQKFNVVKGTFRSKNLNSIHIISKGNLTVDESLYQSSSTIQCSNCKLSNLGYMLTIPVTLYASGDQHELENNGTVVVDMKTRSVSWYWDITNNGRFILYCAYCLQGSSYTLTFYGRMSNKATLVSYGVGLNMYGSSSNKNYLGKVVIYGVPSLKSGHQNPSLQTYGNWSEHVKASYGKPVVWDVRYQVNVYFYVRSTDGYTFESCTTYGRIYTSVQYQTGLPNLPALVFSRQLMISRDSTFYAQSTGYNPQIAFGSGALVTVDRLHLKGGWIMNVTGATFSAVRYLVLESGSRLVSSSSSNTVQLNGSVSLQQEAVVSISHSDLAINGDILMAGTLEIDNSTACVTGEFHWTDGTLKGRNGSLNLHGGGAISSDYIKTVDGVSMTLEGQKSKVGYAGIVAEYFQYRVATDVTPQVNSIYGYYYPGRTVSSGYLPEEFDNLTYTPNVVQLEQSLTRLPTVWGNGPIKYLTSSYGVDSSSPDSFTYNYAVRYLCFLNLPNNGNYRFYFSTGYGQVRLWIDDQKLFEGRSYSSYFDEQVTGYYNLSGGYRKLRVDIFVRSSYWDTYGSMVIVKLEGPGVPKQVLSSQNLSYAYQNGSSWVYASQHFLAQSRDSAMTVAGEGLIVAKSGSVINITSSGILQILSDIIYYSHASQGTTARIINAGVINKTGDAGTATFYAVYDNQGGQLITTSGKIEFLDAEKQGGVALWDNPNGGSFLDPENWVPRRIPLATDIVYVTVPGTYKFIITSATSITVKSLILGASNSKPDVLIEHLSNLVVTHRLDIHTTQVELQGSIFAGHLTWSGSLLLGTAGVGKAVITAQQSLVVFRGEYQYKQLTKLEIRNQGNMTVDRTMSNGALYCQDCRVVNEHQARIHMYRCNMNGGTNGQSPDDDGFIYGLINYGIFAQVWATSTSSVNFRWHVRNYGRMLFLNTYYGSTTNVYMQGVIINNGAMEYYMTSVSLRYVTLPTSNGSWSIYSTPARQYGLNSPMWIPGGYDAGLKYDQFIHDIYYNSTLDVYRPGGLWKCCPVSVSFSYLYSNYGPIRFHTLKTYGWVYVSIPSNSHGARLYIDGTLNLSENTELRVDGSSSTGNNTITFGNKSTVQLGRLTYVSSGWTLVVEENATVSCKGDLSAILTSYINISRGSDVVVDGQLIVQDSARLNVDSRRILVKDGLYIAGNVNLTNSQVVSERTTRWNKGEITGPSGHVVVQGRLDVYGRSSKTLNDVTLTLHAKKWHSYTGIIAEYFQYRVGTDRTPYRSSLYGYYAGCPSCNVVPQAFDDPSTAPNVARIEPSLNRKPRLYGHAPLVFDQSGRSYDWSSAESFTYNYAVRFSAFIRIWYPGMHTFYFLTGRGRIRLWIDGSRRFTGRSYTSLLEEQRTSLYLSEGYHHVRIDNIQRSSSWNFEKNLLIVSYSSGCIPKQPLTSNNLYYKITVNGTYEFASPAFKVFNDSSVCTSNDSLNELQSYDLGISYGVVRDSGLFVPVNGSAVSIEKSGVLDVQSDTSWSYDSSQGTRAYLRVLGGIGKSSGSATVDLHCLFNDAGGCKKVEKGLLNLGTAGSKNTVEAFPNCLLCMLSNLFLVLPALSPPSAAPPKPASQTTVPPVCIAPSTTARPPSTGLLTTTVSTTTSVTNQADTTRPPSTLPPTSSSSSREQTSGIPTGIDSSLNPTTHPPTRPTTQVVQYATTRSLSASTAGTGKVTASAWIGSEHSGTRVPPGSIEPPVPFGKAGN